MPRLAGGWKICWRTSSKRARLSPIDRALAHELVLGSVRHQALLDWLIVRRTDGRQQPPMMRALLRTALYQLFILDRIPDHAAVHEAVELARQLGFEAQAGFVNALLRGCLRERESLERDIEGLKQSQVDLGYSHPRWLCDRWGPTLWSRPTSSLADLEQSGPVGLWPDQHTEIVADGVGGAPGRGRD